MANLPSCLVVMEACGSAHYWARLFESYGHSTKLIAPQFVKPYVKSNKNDALDAEAICEAVQRPNMRFVAVKNEEQISLQSTHRIRSQLIKTRTALVNQIRELLLEQGVAISCGRIKLHNKLINLLDPESDKLSPYMKEIMQDQREHLDYLETRISKYDEIIKQHANSNKYALLLKTIPGIGPLIATAFMSSIGDISIFRNGRELSAFLGLLPRQHSTGGKSTLRGISKRGDVYLRTILIHGARARLRWAATKTDLTSQWICKLEKRRGKNIAAIALANKMARTAYAMLKTGEIYNEKHNPLYC